MGTLLGIAVKHEKRGELFKLDEAEITVAAGVTGDLRGKPGKRQVTVLALESWKAACAELGQNLDWSLRRANLLTEGLAFGNTTGQKIQIGEALLEITGETDPCYRMDEVAPGLQNALTPHWRGGVTCRVLQAGKIKIGDEARFEGEFG